MAQQSDGQRRDGRGQGSGRSSREPGARRTGDGKRAAKVGESRRPGASGKTEPERGAGRGGAGGGQGRTAGMGERRSQGSPGKGAEHRVRASRERAGAQAGGPSSSRRNEPRIPEDVLPEELPRGTLLELRTLPEGLATIVARHLAAAQRCVANGDLDQAADHVDAARSRAGRVSAVREAAAIIAYQRGRYEEAIREIRTVRRMSSSPEYLPMLADCERGLGRPQRALDLIRAADLARLQPEVKVELLIVTAGARADLGDIEAAVVTLRVPELTRLPPGTPRARLQYAYADLLLRAGRRQEAWEWMERAAGSDIGEETDAAARCDEFAGLNFSEEPLSFDKPS